MYLNFFLVSKVEYIDFLEKRFAVANKERNVIQESEKIFTKTEECKMVIAESMEELMQIEKSSILNEILFEGLKFIFVRENENVHRGHFENLTAITYRNEKEHKNLSLFYNGKVMEFIETGYSLN